MRLYQYVEVDDNACYNFYLSFYDTIERRYQCIFVEYNAQPNRLINYSGHDIWCDRYPHAYNFIGNLS